MDAGAIPHRGINTLSVLVHRRGNNEFHQVDAGSDCALTPEILVLVEIPTASNRAT